jgi:hypothetical protein
VKLLLAMSLSAFPIKFTHFYVLCCLSRHFVLYYKEDRQHDGGAVKGGQERVATSSHQDSQPSTPWRVRFFRWLRYVLRFVWGTLIVSIVVGIIVSLSTATTDTPLSKLNIIHLVLAFPVLVVSSLGVLILLTLLSWIGGREREATEPRSLSEQDRVYMLGRLRLRYEQMLAQSL